MKTVRESEFLYADSWCSIEGLIESLGEIRAKTNQDINVSVRNGCIELTWDRDMTEDELQRDREYSRISEESDKEERRRKWEELKKEFGGGEKSST